MTYLCLLIRRVWVVMDSESETKIAPNPTKRCSLLKKSKFAYNMCPEMFAVRYKTFTIQRGNALHRNVSFVPFECFVRCTVQHSLLWSGDHGIHAWRLLHNDFNFRCLQYQSWYWCKGDLCSIYPDGRHANADDFRRQHQRLHATVAPTVLVNWDCPKTVRTPTNEDVRNHSCWMRAVGKLT